MPKAWVSEDNYPASVEQDASVLAFVCSESQLKCTAFWAEVVTIRKGQVSPSLVILAVALPLAAVGHRHYVSTSALLAIEGLLLKVCSGDRRTVLAADWPCSVRKVIRSARAKRQKSIVSAGKAVSVC